MKKHKYIILIIGTFLIVFSLILYFNIKKNSNNDFRTIKLHEETKKILESLDDKVYINIYLNGNLSPQCIKLQDSLTLLLNNFKSYTNKEIDWSLVEIDEVEVNKNGQIYSPLKDSDIYPIFIKDQEKYFKIYPYATVHYKEKMSLPIVLLPPSLSNSMGMRNDTINELSANNLKEAVNDLEYQIIESIYLLKQKGKKKIAFLQGHLELDPVYTWDIRNTLKKYYDIEFFDLNTDGIHLATNYTLKDANNQIKQLAQYEVVIIANPQEPYDNMEKLVIDQYIMNGGKILFLLDGTSAHMDNFTDGSLSFILNKNNLDLDTFLNNYGAQINYDLIQDQTCTKIPLRMPNKKQVLVDWQYNPLLISNQDHIISCYGDSILTSFASSIEIIKPDKTTVLLSSSEKSNVLDEKENVSLDIINYPPEKFEGEKIVGVLIEDEFNSNFLELTDTKELKIKKKSSQNKMILISDGDIIANLYTPPNLHYILGYNPYNPWGHNILEGNTNFILNSIQYLCDDESLIKILNKTK